MSGICRECMKRKDRVFSAGHYGGGSYNRGGRIYPSSICLDCATDLMTYAAPGHSTVSRWDILSLKRIVAQD